MGNLSQPPEVATPDCSSPAPQVAWTSGAQAFYVEYKSWVPANRPRTAQLAEAIGFEVLGASDGSFTVQWLQPVQVAQIRCENDIDYVAYVIPPPIVTGPVPEVGEQPPTKSLEPTRDR